MRDPYLAPHDPRALAYEVAETVEPGAAGSIFTGLTLLDQNAPIERALETLLEDNRFSPWYGVGDLSAWLIRWLQSAVLYNVSEFTPHETGLVLSEIRDGAPLTSRLHSYRTLINYLALRDEFGVAVDHTRAESLHAHPAQDELPFGCNAREQDLDVSLPDALEVTVYLSQHDLPLSIRLYVDNPYDSTNRSVQVDLLSAPADRRLHYLAFAALCLDFWMSRLLSMVVYHGDLADIFWTTDYHYSGRYRFINHEEELKRIETALEYLNPEERVMFYSLTWTGAFLPPLHEDRDFEEGTKLTGRNLITGFNYGPDERILRSF